jgi:hypothetical protein
MLSAAFLEFDTSVWGLFGEVGGPMTKADQGQLYLAAHKLAVSPFGQNARTMFKGDKYSIGTGGFDRTTYGREFLNLRYAATSGFRVA